MKRGLTTEQAQRGEQPAPLTGAEWDRLWRRSVDCEMEAHRREPDRFFRSPLFPPAEEKTGGAGS